MRRYDPNASLSVWAVFLGAVLGLGVGALLGFGALGLALAAFAGILLAGAVASSLGIVGERGGKESGGDDLPPGYHDY